MSWATYSGVEVKEGALKWGLRLLGIALFVGPFIAAFAMHNWNIVEAVLPSEAEMSGITERFEGLSGAPFENVELVGQQIVGDNIELTIKFTSKIGFDLEIDEFSGNLTCALETPHAYLSVVRLKEPVVVMANSQAEIHLTANVTQATAHYATYHFGESPLVNIENLRFKIYGVTIDTTMSVQNLSIISLG
jgi:hypothetical protein